MLSPARRVVPAASVAVRWEEFPALRASHTSARSHWRRSNHGRGCRRSGRSGSGAYADALRARSPSPPQCLRGRGTPMSSAGVRRGPHSSTGRGAQNRAGDRGERVAETGCRAADRRCSARRSRPPAPAVPAQPGPRRSPVGSRPTPAQLDAASDAGGRHTAETLAQRGERGAGDLTALGSAGDDGEAPWNWPRRAPECRADRAASTLLLRRRGADPRRRPRSPRSGGRGKSDIAQQAEVDVRSRPQERAEEHAAQAHLGLVECAGRSRRIDSSVAA